MTLTTTGLLSGSPATASGIYPLVLSATVTGGSAATQNFNLVVGAPSAPVGLSATSGASSATDYLVSPDRYRGVSSQRIPPVTPYIGGIARPLISVGNVTTYNATGLTNGTTYTFTVAAINSIDTGPTSTTSVIPATVPDQPEAPTATPGPESAGLTWSAPYNEGSSITGYVVTPYDGATEGTPVTLGNVTSYDFTGLNNGDNYTFTVAAINGVGTGAASSASNSVTPVDVPDQPAAPGVTPGDQSVAVTWSPPGDEGSSINGYVVTPYDGATEGTPVTLGNVTSYDFTGLNNGDSYTFAVAAINGVGTRSRVLGLKPGDSVDRA